MAAARLNDRVRVERRAALVDDGDPVLWPEGDEVENGGDTVDFEETTEGDGAGNFEAEFRRIGPAKPLRVEIRELPDGGETVLASKLSGLAPCLVIMRASAFSRSITTDDRFVELIPNGGERILNIRTAPPPGRGQWITFLCEAGGAT